MKVEALDLASVDSIAALAKRLDGRPVDVLINNAGLLGDVPKQSIGSLDRQEFDYVLGVNVSGALNIGFRALGADWRGEGIMVGLIAPGVLEVIDAMTLESNGKALNYDGAVIPW